MSLILENLSPQVTVLGNRQSFNFNVDPAGGENTSAFTLLNYFTPKTNVNAISTLEFMTPNFKGFRFNHFLSNLVSDTYGNFNFEQYDRFGTATPVWGYVIPTTGPSNFKIYCPVDVSNNVIGNVANGVLSTDAVNKGQMDTADTTTLNSAKSYTDSKTYTASQISNFDTQVRTSRLDQMAIPTANLNMNGRVITNLGSGTLSTDSVTLGQLTSRLSWFTDNRGSGTPSINTNVALIVDGAIQFTNRYFYYGASASGTIPTSETAGFASSTNTYNISGTLIRAFQFHATSSIRVKNVLSSDSNKIETEAVDLLKKIPIVKYEFKDKLKVGAGEVYGVIAEQLNEVAPSYVNMHDYSFIPNIMIKANLKKLKIIGNNSYDVELDTEKYEIDKDSKQLRIMNANSSYDVNIVDISSSRIRINTTEELGDEVFVYGTYEKCPTVCKEKMFELSILVVQNLLKRIEKLEKKGNK